MSFIEANLGPAERLGEILFGLIMTLTFTLGAGVLFGGEEGATQQLLLATLGCNVAWGVIDAALYILGLVFHRGRLSRLGTAIATTTDDARALAMVAEELDETIAPITSATGREALYRDVLARVRTGTPRGPRIDAADFKAAAVVFWSVVITTLPAAIPYFFVRDPWYALRASNALLIAVLFGVGYRWAGYTTLNRWLCAFTLTAFGIALVALAIALGG